MKQKILVTGSIAYDRIMNFPGYFKDQILPDKIHILNVSFFVNQLKEGFGGTGGNIAYNLSLLGIKPTVVGNVGEKDFSIYQQWMKKHKYDLSLLNIVPKEQTASAYIITDQDDNQIAGFYPGAMLKSLKAASCKLKASLAIVSPQNPQDMVKLPEVFKRSKTPYIFDPGQQVTSLSGAQLKKAINGSKVLIGNDYEISLISKKTGWKNKDLLKKAELLVTTLGAKGSTIQTNNKIYKIPPAKPKNTSDPTGAGDAFRAGLIKGLIEDWPLKKTGRLAGLVSVYTVEKYGTQTHKFTQKELSNRYRQNFKDKL